MKLNYIEGDLFTGKHKVIIHGCNTQGGFGSGFAGNLRKKFPDVPNAYYAEHKKNGLFLGTVLWVESNGVLIGNCMTQPTYARDQKQHVDYEAFRSCMRSVNQASEDGIYGTFAENGFSDFSMPMIGADLAGGDWNILSKIISEELTSVSPTIYVYPRSKHNIKELPVFK